MYPDESYLSVFSEILTNTKNDIIIFVIVLVIAMILVLVPICGIYLNHRKKEHQLEMEERKREHGMELEERKREREMTLDYQAKLVEVVNSNAEVVNNNTRALTTLQCNIDSNVKLTDNLQDAVGSLEHTVIEVRVMATELMTKMKEVYEDSGNITHHMNNSCIPKMEKIIRGNEELEKRIDALEKGVQELIKKEELKTNSKDK